MLYDEIIMIEFDPTQFNEDKFFMCVDNIYKNEVWSSRNGKVLLRANSSIHGDSITPITWTVVSSADAKYQVGDWFEASMGHVLPCKNPSATNENDRQCRLHSLDAVNSTNQRSLATNAVKNVRQLVPNALHTDLIAVNSTVVVAGSGKTAKALSVLIVKDPQAARTANVRNTTVKKVKVASSTAQGRDRFGRFLAKDVMTRFKPVEAAQGRDSSGRFLPKK